MGVENAIAQSVAAYHGVALAKRRIRLHTDRTVKIICSNLKELS